MFRWCIVRKKNKQGDYIFCARKVGVKWRIRPNWSRSSVMNPYHKQPSTFTKSIIIVFSSLCCFNSYHFARCLKWVSASSSYSSLVCQNNNLLAISSSCLIFYHLWFPLDVTFCRLLYISRADMRPFYITLRVIRSILVSHVFSWFSQGFSHNLQCSTEASATDGLGSPPSK